MLSFFKKKKESKNLTAYIDGEAISIENVNDGVFSEKILGDGLAIEPTGNLIVAPADGIISSVIAESKHAVGMTLNNGLEILIHEGLDTVSLKGEGFKLLVKEGQKVKAGDKLIEFDGKLLEEKKLRKTCILVVLNSADYPELKFHTNTAVVSGETIIAEF